MTVPDTRISLLHRLHDRDDSSAWMEFCAIYERVIYRIASRHGLQDADSREVSQEVLMTVSRRISEFDPHGSAKFRSWLATVARNATIDLLRKKKLVTGDSELQLGLARIPAAQDEAASEAEAFGVAEKREQFRWAAEQVKASMAASTWQAFWLTAVEGTTAEVVAERLGMTPGAIYVARCRTLRKIKHIVERFRADEAKNPETDKSKGGAV
ncbi:MAG: RNA polymerase sigma factor [Pirellulaceae bacterium]